MNHANRRRLEYRERGSGGGVRSSYPHSKSMHSKSIYWLAWAVAQYLWIFFSHFWLNINLAKLLPATAADLYPINGTPGKTDRNANRKEDSMLKIQITIRSYVSRASLRTDQLKWGVMGSADEQVHLEPMRGEKHRYFICENTRSFISGV